MFECIVFLSVYDNVIKFELLSLWVIFLFELIWFSLKVKKILN